jgi:hypothetical protein
MIDDLLFLVIALGLALSAYYGRAELIDARNQRILTIWRSPRQAVVNLDTHATEGATTLHWVVEGLPLEADVKFPAPHTKA